MTRVTKVMAAFLVCMLFSDMAYAHLIFATTTPVPPGSNGRIAGDAAKFNEAAIEVLNAQGNSVARVILEVLDRKDTAGQEKNLPIKGEVFKIEDRTAFLILPEKTKSGNLIPWVWYAPTLKGLPGKAEKWMFDRFLENGIAIAGVDVGESYGSPKGRAVYSALYKELVEKRGLAKKASLLARSRGGLMLYNWAAENPESVACIAGIYPVCNLSSYPGLGRACGAYGMTKEQLAAKLTKHNPIDRLAPLARAKVPIYHIHGDKDTLVPLDKNSAELKKRYDKLGGKMTLEVVKGQGHNMWSGWFHSQELVKFVITHAREDKPKEPDRIVLEKQFRELPMEARRLAGPLFWLRGEQEREVGLAYLFHPRGTGHRIRFSQK